MANTVEAIELAYRSNIAAAAAADAKAMKDLGTSFTDTEAKIIKSLPAYDTVNKRLEGAAVAARMAEKANNDFANAKARLEVELRKGDITLDQYNEKLRRQGVLLQESLVKADAAGKALDAKFTQPLTQAGKAAGNAATSFDKVNYTLRQTGLQFVDVAQQIASGAPLLTTFVQQGGQVAQVAAASGVSLRQFAGALGGLAASNAALIAITATAAGIVALGVAAETSARQLNSIQNQLRATRADYQALGEEVIKASKAVAATSGIGTADARAAGASIAGATRFSGTQQDLQSLIKLAGDLAAVMGTTVPEASRRLTEAIDDPAAAAKKWATDGLPTLNQGLAYSISLMAQAGDKAGATARVIQSLDQAYRGAADPPTQLGKALRDLSNAFTEAGQNGKSFAEEFGTVINDTVASALNSITALIRVVKDFREWADRNVPGGSSVPLNAVRRSVDPFSNLWEGISRLFGGGAPSGGSVLSAPPTIPFGRLPNGSTSLPADVRNQIYRLAEAGNYAGDINLSARQADFATLIAAAERSSPGQVSPKGAIGRFQLMPGTAAEVGVDPYNDDQNVQGGLKYIAKLWAMPEFGGDPTLVAMAYNWGPANVKKFLSGVKTLGDVPEETNKYVQRVTGKSLLSDDRFNIPLPPTPPEGGANARALNDALSNAIGSGGLYFQRRQNQAEQQQVQIGLAAATSAENVEMLTQRLRDLKVAEAGLITEQDRLVRSMRDAAVTQGDLTEYDRAMLDVERQIAVAVRDKDGAYQALAESLAKASEASRLYKEFNTTVAATERQVQAQLAINDAYDGTAESLSRAANFQKAYAEAREKFGAQAPELEQQARRYADALDRQAAATRSLEQQQASVNALANSFSSAFGTIADAITTAFIQGQGAAVSWGNVMKAVATQVLKSFAQLAIINPLLNSIFAQNNGTLGVALGVLGRGGAASSGGEGGGNFLGAASNAFTFGQIGDALGLTNFGGQLSNFGNYIGLTGEGGLLSNIGLGGIGSGITGFLNTPLLGQAALTNATNSALAGMGGLYGPATPSSLGLSGVTIGQVLSGVGLGFGAGSLAGGYLQGALNKTGPGPQIGAGAGALTGAALGSIIPGIGTVIGGLLGGVLGGGGGAFIGPRPASAFSSTGVELTPDGRLNIGKSVEQIYGSSRDAAVQGADTINKILDALGLTLTDIGALRQIGQNTPGGFIDPSKFSDFNSAFGQLRFTAANDNDLSARLSGRSFGTPEELQSLVTAFRETNASAQTFLTQTSASLTQILRPAGTFNDQLNALWKQYQEAINQTQAFLASGNLTAENTTKLMQAEAELAAARERSISLARAQIDAEQLARNVDWNSRYLRATASLSGRPADSLNAALYEFDNAANQQRLEYHYWLTGLYGESIRETQSYADQMALLERTLQQERLAVQKQFADQSVNVERDRAQAANTAAGLIASLSQYAAGLGTSGASPLSPTAQYSLASRQFDAVAGAAVAGDYRSLQQLTNYSDRLLSSSRAVYGSGSQYATDFERVTGVLSSVSQLSPDTLTNSVYQASMLTQTATLVQALDAVKTEITLLRTTVANTAYAPARSVA